jgi:hypothetical protein
MSYESLKGRVNSFAINVKEDMENQEDPSYHSANYNSYAHRTNTGIRLTRTRGELEKNINKSSLSTNDKTRLHTLIANAFKTSPSTSQSRKSRKSRKSKSRKSRKSRK